MDFKPWPEIKKYSGIHCVITEKLHGTNAQIVVFEYTSTNCESHEPRLGIKAGKRTGWVLPGKDTDNYGFAAWVEENKEELIAKLGLGTHYGEWVGPGIGSTYNLTEKRFVLFDTRRFPPERPRPARVDVVPVLHYGMATPEVIAQVLADLKTSSVYAPGFDRPEGIVVFYPHFRTSQKLVFKPEETGWTRKSGKPGDKAIRESINVSHLLQPIRLEKLLMRDSSYKDNYPESMTTIVQEYLNDMEKEEQFVGCDENTIKALRKKVYPWIMTIIENPTLLQHS